MTTTDQVTGEVFYRGKWYESPAEAAEAERRDQEEAATEADRIHDERRDEGWKTQSSRP